MPQHVPPARALSVTNAPLPLSSSTWAKRVRSRCWRWSPNLGLATGWGYPPGEAAHRSRRILAMVSSLLGWHFPTPAPSPAPCSPSWCTLLGSRLFITANALLIVSDMQRSSLSCKGYLFNPFSILKHTTQKSTDVSVFTAPSVHSLSAKFASHHHFLLDHWLRYQTTLAREDAVLFFTKCALLCASSPWFLYCTTNSSLHFNSSCP